MIEVDHHELVLRYEDLRIRSPTRHARLMASLGRDGQLSPVLVVAVENRYILIDGYARVAALRAIGEDRVRAVDLPMSETEALILQHRQENARERPALEEGWLVHHLLTQRGFSQEEVAVALMRSTSWVSRRLGLVKTLPEEVQEEVRRGKVPAYAAAKYLLPLARAKRSQCVTLAKHLPTGQVSVRQIEKIYVAWKQADAVGRERIVASPGLLLKTEVELPEEEKLLLKDLKILAGILRRASYRLQKIPGWAEGIPRPLEQAALELWVGYRNLKNGLEELGLHAGS